MTATFCFGQTEIRPVGKYEVGDTSIEVKSWKDLNSIREFKKVKGQDIELFKNYYLDTKLLREEGMFKGGWCFGVWKFYNVNGQLEKEINYDNNIKTLYGKLNEPYDDVFNQIQHAADSLLIEKYGRDFFTDNIIQNTNRSYYYGSGTSGRWFEVPNYRPNEFLMRYDIKLDGKRYSFFEFTLDSLGNLKKKKSLESFSNLKKRNCITLTIADSIALQNGLTNEAKPFGHRFGYSPDSLQKETGKLEIHVIGMPYDKKIDGNEITEFFYYIVLDPWTGEFIRKETDRIITYVDKHSRTTIIK